jgi:hypothetical protein
MGKLMLRAIWAATAKPMLGAIWAVRAFAGLCGGAGFYAAWVSISHILHGDAAGPWLLPAAAGVATLVFAVALCALETNTVTISGKELMRRAGVMGLLLLYGFALLPYFGFLAASAALVLIMALLYAADRLVVGAGGLAIVVVMWAIFAYVIATPLPEGLWWQ